MLTTNTAERGFFPRVFEESIITPVVVQPEAEKNHGDKQAENDGGGNKIHLT